MYDYTDLSPLKKGIVLIFCFCAFLFAIPVSSGCFYFLTGYTYNHLLIISAIFYNTNIPFALLSLVLGLLIVPATFVILVKILSPKASLFGSARMSTSAEIRANNLYKINPDSIIVGKYKGKHIAFNGDLHVFLAALTGSGKGVSFVIPNLLNWGYSAIVLDIKKECYNFTATYREKVLKNEVFIFQPLENQTDCFNPFDFLGEGEKAIADIQTMADILIIIDDEYWDNKARQLFLGLALLIVEQGKFLGLQNNIGQIFYMLGGELNLKDQLNEYIDSINDNDETEISSECSVLLYSFINEEDKPRGSIISSLSKHLELWIDPRINRATSKSSFDFRTFRKKKQTLYLVSSPGDLKRLNCIFRLILESFISSNTRSDEELGKKGFKIPVLMLLDEFISLGKMAKLIHSLSYIRGWGVKIATIIQSPNQLKDLYGSALANFFEENHRCSILFRPNRMSNERVQEMANAIGHITAKSKSKSRPLFGAAGTRTVSESETQGFLVTPDQIRDMPDSRQFVMIDGQRPIYSNKIFYYKDRMFKKKAKLPVRELPLPITEDTLEFSIPDSRNNESLTDKVKKITIPDGDLTENELEEITVKFCDLVAEL